MMKFEGTCTVLGIKKSQSDWVLRVVLGGLHDALADLLPMGAHTILTVKLKDPDAIADVRVGGELSLKSFLQKDFSLNTLSVVS